MNQKVWVNSRFSVTDEIWCLWLGSSKK